MVLTQFLSNMLTKKYHEGKIMSYSHSAHYNHSRTQNDQLNIDHKHLLCTHIENVKKALTLLPFHSLVCTSPFKVKALPAHDASKVRASGPGLNAAGVPASLPVEFTIDARDAGEGLLTVQILVSHRILFFFLRHFIL